MFPVPFEDFLLQDFKRPYLDNQIHFEEEQQSSEFEINIMMEIEQNSVKEDNATMKVEDSIKIDPESSMNISDGYTEIETHSSLNVEETKTQQ